jgi:hypothetical protein
VRAFGGGVSSAARRLRRRALRWRSIIRSMID